MMMGFQASLRNSPCVLLVITFIADLAGAHKAGIYKAARDETAAMRLRGGAGDDSHLSRIPFSSYEKELNSSTTNLMDDNLYPSRNSTATTDTAPAVSLVSRGKLNTYRERDGWSDTNDVRHTFHSLSGICQGVPTDSCGDCLTTVATDWRWCSSPGLCFNTSATSTNEVDCKNFCVGDVFFQVSRSSSSEEDDDDEEEENEGERETNLCSVVEDDLSLLAVVASFVVLVMCPLCLFCGCMYVAMQRCSYILNNKVHPTGSGTILGGVSTIDRQQSEFMRSRLAVAAVAEPPDASRMVTTAQAATAVPLTGLLPRAEVTPVIVGPRPCVHQAFLPSARDSVIGQALALAPAASLDNIACSDMDRSAAGLAGLRAGVVGSSNSADSSSNNYREDSLYTTNNNTQNIGRAANIVNSSRNVGGDQDWAAGSSSCAGFGTSVVVTAAGLEASGTVHAQARISASSSNADNSNSAGHSSSDISRDTSRGGVNDSCNSSGSGSAHRSSHTHAHLHPHSQSQSQSSHSSMGYGNRRTNDSASGSTTTDLAAAGAGGGSAGSGGVSEPRSLFGFYSYSRVPHQDRSASHQRLARRPLFASMGATGTAARGAVGVVRAVREGAAAEEDEEAPVLATAILCDPLEGLEMLRGNSPSEGVSSLSTPHSQQQQHRQQQDMEVSSVESSASNRASEEDGLGANAVERGGGGGRVSAAVSSLSSRAISSRV